MGDNEEKIRFLGKLAAERIDGYMAHLAHGGKADPYEEEYIDELLLELEELRGGINYAERRDSEKAAVFDR